MFWLIGTAFALRNFLALTMLGHFTRVFGVFREIGDLLVFGWVWALRQILGPNRQQKSEPEKNRKHVDFFSFRGGFK